MRNKFLLFISDSVYSTLLQQPGMPKRGGEGEVASDKHLKE
jgi:hypothetical protein